MESMEGASANLCYEMEINSPANLFRVESMAQAFLAKQYNIVYALLTQNRLVFDAIVDQLMKNRVLDHEDLIKIRHSLLG